MLNFTEKIKEEIISSGFENECCKLAFLSGFIRTSGSIISRGGQYGCQIITENEHTAEFLCDLLEHSFGITSSALDAKFDVFSGRDKLTFECVGEKMGQLLQHLKIIQMDKSGAYLNFSIDDELVEKECCKSAFCRGAFLGGGSCTLPEEQTYSRTGYHFEIVFSNKLTADDFSQLLCDCEILAKLVSRKDSTVVYVKSKEVISDILNLLNCNDCLDKLNKIVELKDRTNNQNRINNCSVSNIDKTVTASVAQIKAIETIAQTIGLKSLDKNLFELAECRLADSSASMQELADRLNITKSCLNHRMRKIMDIASQLN